MRECGSASTPTTSASRYTTRPLSAVLTFTRTERAAMCQMRENTIGMQKIGYEDQIVSQLFEAHDTHDTEKYVYVSGARCGHDPAMFALSFDVYDCLRI